MPALTRQTFAIVLVLLLLAGACGGGEEDADDTAQTSATQDTAEAGESAAPEPAASDTADGAVEVMSEPAEPTEAATSVERDGVVLDCSVISPEEMAELTGLEITFAQADDLGGVLTCDYGSIVPSSGDQTIELELEVNVGLTALQQDGEPVEDAGPDAAVEEGRGAAIVDGNRLVVSAFGLDVESVRAVLIAFAQRFGGGAAGGDGESGEAADGGTDTASAQEPPLPTDGGELCALASAADLSLAGERDSLQSSSHTDDGCRFNLAEGMLNFNIHLSEGYDGATGEVLLDAVANRFPDVRSTTPYDGDIGQAAVVTENDFRRTLYILFTDTYVLQVQDSEDRLEPAQLQTLVENLIAVA